MEVSTLRQGDRRLHPGGRSTAALALAGRSLMRQLLLALELARVIAGEAGGCPTLGALAVAHVAERNDVWYGDADPSARDLAVALVWRAWPDPTEGALFLLGPGDGQNPAMARLLEGREVTLHVACEGGDFVKAWK